MTTIRLETTISAPPERCFDLSRDIDFHQKTAEKTKERAIAGRTSGLCEKGDTITWEAIHFGIRQNLKVEITEMNAPIFFEDRMIKGAFKCMRHEHHFIANGNETQMLDLFEYEVPFGVFGKIFDLLILKSYMTKFLEARNIMIKKVAENS